MKGNGKNQNQHDPQPEYRRGLPEKSSGHSDMVEDGVPFDGGDDPNGNGDEQGQNQSRDGELNGGRHPLQDQIKGRLAVAKRLAEIPMEGALEKPPVLHDHRIGESHLLAELGHLFRRRIHGHQERGRVAGQVENDEDDQGNADQNEDRVKKPFEDVKLHDFIPGFYAYVLTALSAYLKRIL